MFWNACQLSAGLPCARITPVLHAEIHSPPAHLTYILGAWWNFGKSFEHALFICKTVWYSCDGFFCKDYGNRIRKQLVPAVVSFAKQGTETETPYGPGLPARPPEAKWRRKKNLRCRSASESVFAGILDQIFQGFIDSENVFWDAEMFKIWQIYVLGVKYLTNVGVLYVMMYVVCAGKTNR